VASAARAASVACGPPSPYLTEAQLLADKKQQNRLFAWAEDSGYVSWWLDGAWFNMAPNRPNIFYTGHYYLGKAIPRSLQARITSINGTTLTLDRSAAVSTTDATVYLDSAPIINTRERLDVDERLGPLAYSGRRFAFTENSLHPESDRLAASPHHLIINVNTNIGVTPKSHSGEP
jgi:hypothetical protein